MSNLTISLEEVMTLSQRIQEINSLDMESINITQNGISVPINRQLIHFIQKFKISNFVAISTGMIFINKNISEDTTNELKPGNYYWFRHKIEKTWLMGYCFKNSDGILLLEIVGEKTWDVSKTNIDSFEWKILKNPSS